MASAGLVAQVGLVDAGFDGLDGVEVAVLAQEVAAQRLEERFDRRLGGAIVHDQAGGFVDLLLAVQQVGQGRQQLRTRGVAVCAGQAGGRDVEESVQVDAHGRVVDAAHQFARARSLKSAADGVGEREGVEGAVPVAELVGDVELGDAGNGGLGDGVGELDGIGALAEGIRQRVGDGLGIFAQDRVDQVRAAVPLGGLDVGREDVGEVLEGRFQDLHEVDGPAPGVGFLHAAGVGVTAGEGADDGFGQVPAGDIQGLQGFVGEVEDVAGGEVAVVGGCREEHVGNGGLVHAGLDGREQAAFGAGGVAHLDEAPEPALERGRVGGGVGQGADLELRRRSG